MQASFELSDPAGFSVQSFYMWRIFKFLGILYGKKFKMAIHALCTFIFLVRLQLLINISGVDILKVSLLALATGFITIDLVLCYSNFLQDVLLIFS
jgi:hypothetical protein